MMKKNISNPFDRNTSLQALLTCKKQFQLLSATTEFVFIFYLVFAGKNRSEEPVPEDLFVEEAVYLTVFARTYHEVRSTLAANKVGRGMFIRPRAGQDRPGGKAGGKGKPRPQT